ncbi:MAG: cystathionine beta-lyase [Chitinivibrionales bacterium]|nr:cystathionine beta-lyase [Chitinivibrionales bacterium]
MTDPLTPYGNKPMVTPIVNAVSLGSTESLICIPYLTTMLYMPEERREMFGVNKNTVRLSCGIEQTDVLTKDIEQALKEV